MCFILSTITAVGHLDAKVGPWGTINTFSSAPSAKGVARSTLEAACGVVKCYRHERPKGLGGGFCGAQVQDCHASQVPE